MPHIRTIIIALLSFIALITLAGTGMATQGDLVQLNSDGTVQIIDTQWSSTEVSERQSLELTITIQNTGKNTKSGEFSFLQSGGSEASVTFSPKTINYDLEPGERKRYTIEVKGDNNGITSSETLDISIDTNGDDLPDQPADGVYKQVTVYPSSASISEGTINPSGERQSISKTFTQFKDNSSGILGGYDSNIPPVTSTSDGFEDNSQGRVFNFLRMSNNNNRPAIVETGNSDEARVGFAVRNVPNTEHYTIQLNYLFQNNNFTEAEVKVVDSNGVEIDKRTSYYINDTGQRETRYFTLTDKESQHLRQNKTLYIVVDSKGTSNATGERLSIFFGQLLSDDNYIKTTQKNILVDDMVTTTPTEWQNFNSDTQSLGDIQVDEYKTEETIVVANKVHNYGNSVGTKQLVLYENGQITDQKKVTVNPGETIYTVYTMSKSESGVYVFEPSGGDSAATAVVSTDETIPPVARISETEDYHNGKLMADPLSSDSIHLDGSNSFAPTGDIVSYEWDLEWTSNRTGSEVYPTVSSQGTYQIVLTVEDSNGLTSTDTETVYSGTTDPTAKTLTDTTVTIDKNIPFDASNSSHEDPHRTIDSYNWNFEDGTTATGRTTDHSFNEPGTYDVELTVTDDLGNTNTDIRTIEVTPPQAHADITVSPNEDLVGRQFSFDASNSFADGDSTIESYTWNFGDGTTETTTSATNTHTYSSTGNYTTEVVVENNYGETDSAVVSVSVIEAPFTIGIDGPTTADTSTDITVNNDPTDGRDNVDSWTWNIEGQGTYENQDSITFNYDQAGTYEVTLTGYNKEYDYTDSETLTIDVSTSDPIAKLSSSYENEMYISDQATFDATDSYDPDGTTLSFIMYLSNDNEQFNTDYKKDYLYPYPGEHTSTVVVEDEFGNKDTAEVTVNVINRGPSLDAILTHEPTGNNYEVTSDLSLEVYQGEKSTIDFSDSFHREPRGEITSYEWDTGTDYHTTQNSTITHEWTKNGTYQTTALVRDQWDDTKEVTFTVDVIPTEPVAVINAPKEAYQNETVTFDPSDSYVKNNAAKIVEYRWDFDNGDTRTTSTDSTQDIGFTKKGTYQVQLTVVDENGNTDTTTHTIDIKESNPHAILSGEKDSSVSETTYSGQFDNCGSSGAYGPSSCNYSGDLSGDVAVDSDGIQQWTVPTDGIYTLRAHGARGGNGSDGSPGQGAVIEADFELSKGETIYVLVGQAGQSYSENGAGGGGTFIWSDQQGILLIAGGGGGSADSYGGYTDGMNGNTATYSTRSRSGNEPRSYDGDGGNGADDTGGGTGWVSSGTSGWTADHGTRPLAGGYGGDINYYYDGGFGGGGTGRDSGDSEGGGGGGGYSGGPGGNHYDDDGGGGGGSFIHSSATNVSTSNGGWDYTGNEPHSVYTGNPSSLGYYNYGHGYVDVNLKEAFTSQTYTLDASDSYTERSTNSISEYEFDINGNVTKTTDPTLKYDFKSGKTYNITLTVYDEHGTTDSTSTTVKMIDGSLTHCGSSGRTGPSQTQCDNEYAGTQFEGSVTVDNGTQKWTVPTDGVYKLKAYGAEGGNGYNGSPGRGAIVSGEFQLYKGETIYVIVGQQGLYAGEGGSGGGATYVWSDQRDYPLLVAGGGGGVGDSYNGDTDGVDANLATYSTVSQGGNARSYDGDGGNGNGYAGGGAGWVNDGQDGYGSSSGGTRPLAGGYGGYNSNSSGGFGGGGSERDYSDSEGGGGGGGYSGGPSGDNYNDDGGGGGGSFISSKANNAGTSTGGFGYTGNEPHRAYTGTVKNLSEGYNTGHGQLDIELKEAQIGSGTQPDVVETGTIRVTGQGSYTVKLHDKFDADYVEFTSIQQTAGINGFEYKSPSNNGCNGNENGVAYGAAANTSEGFKQRSIAMVRSSDSTNGHRKIASTTEALYFSYSNQSGYVCNTFAATVSNLGGSSFTFNVDNYGGREEVISYRAYDVGNNGDVDIGFTEINGTGTQTISTGFQPDMASMYSGQKISAKNTNTREYADRFGMSVGFTDFTNQYAMSYNTDSGSTNAHRQTVQSGQIVYNRYSNDDYLYGTTSAQVSGRHSSGFDINVGSHYNTEQVMYTAIKLPDGHSSDVGTYEVTATGTDTFSTSGEPTYIRTLSGQRVSYTNDEYVSPNNSNCSNTYGVAEGWWAEYDGSDQHTMSLGRTSDNMNTHITRGDTGKIINNVYMTNNSHICGNLHVELSGTSSTGFSLSTTDKWVDETIIYQTVNDD